MGYRNDNFRYSVFPIASCSGRCFNHFYTDYTFCLAEWPHAWDMLTSGPEMQAERADLVKWN